MQAVRRKASGATAGGGATLSIHARSTARRTSTLIQLSAAVRMSHAAHEATMPHESPICAAARVHVSIRCRASVERGDGGQVARGRGGAPAVHSPCERTRSQGSVTSGQGTCLQRLSPRSLPRVPEDTTARRGVATAVARRQRRTRHDHRTGRTPACAEFGSCAPGSCALGDGRGAVACAAPWHQAARSPSQRRRRRCVRCAAAWRASAKHPAAAAAVAAAAAAAAAAAVAVAVAFWAWPFGLALALVAWAIRWALRLRLPPSPPSPALPAAQ